MKRKCDNADGPEFLRKKTAVHCILHVSGIQHGDFTPLNNVKGSATKQSDASSFQCLRTRTEL